MKRLMRFAFFAFAVVLSFQVGVIWHKLKTVTETSSVGSVIAEIASPYVDDADEIGGKIDAKIEAIRQTAEAVLQVMSAEP